MGVAGYSGAAVNNVEEYDGSSWRTNASIATARFRLGAGNSGGTIPTGIAFGGQTPIGTAATEEFTPETTALNLKTLTTS